MWRSLSKRLGVAAMLAWSLGGCTFDDGQPWGQAELNLTVNAQPRLDDQGRWLTPRDYAIKVEQLRLELGALRLSMRPAGGVTTFDPASPPSGYSLCHNGHCHADDGRLVDYEDIEIELAQAAGGGAALGQQRVINDWWSLERAQAPLALEPCPDGCPLPYGELGTLAVDVRQVELKLRVYDVRQGQNARLPEGGVEVVATVPLNASISTLLSGEVGKADPGLLRFKSALLLSGKLFDSIDFAAYPELIAQPELAHDLSQNKEFTQALTERLLTTSELEPGLSRLELD